MLPHLIACPDLMKCLLNASISPWVNPCPHCYHLHPSHHFLPPVTASLRASMWSPLMHTSHCSLRSHLKCKSGLASPLRRILPCLPSAPGGKPTSLTWLAGFCLSLQSHPSTLPAPALFNSLNHHLLLPISWTRSSLTFSLDDLLRILPDKLSCCFLWGGWAGGPPQPALGLPLLKLLPQRLLVTRFLMGPLHQALHPTESAFIYPGSPSTAIMQVLDKYQCLDDDKGKTLSHKHYIHPAKQGTETKLESHIHSLRTVIPRKPTSQGTLDHTSHCHICHAVFQ